MRNSIPKMLIRHWLINQINIYPGVWKRWSGSGRHWILIMVLSVCALFSINPAQAQMAMTDAEFDILPAFCHHQSHVSQRHSNVPRSIYWENILGDSFTHVHHYCWALVNLGRSYRTGMAKEQRRTALISAAGDVNYVIERSRPDMPLLAEFHTTRGQALLLAGETKEAEASFATARQIDPTYWRAYLIWAVALKQNGKSKEAAELVAKGLEHSPDSKGLKSLANEFQPNAQKKLRAQ